MPFAALEEQKKRVAANIFEVAAPAPVPGAPAKPASDPGAVADKRKKKSDQITQMRQKISDLSKQRGMKDPAAFQAQMQKQQDRLKQMQQDLSQIK